VEGKREKSEQRREGVRCGGKRRREKKRTTGREGRKEWE
jgi:hypothetical protein